LIPPRQALNILEFWFGSRPYAREAMSKRTRLWFGDRSAPELRPQSDEVLRLRFGALVTAAARGDFDVWESSPRRRLALILLLDQFPRGIYRDSAQAYAQDRKALALSVSGTQLGADAALDPVERIFFYMPMQHAESRELQEEPCCRGPRGTRRRIRAGRTARRATSPPDRALWPLPATQCGAWPNLNCRGSGMAGR
jgi:uncharacterized protein (DUF924 family)